MAIKSKSEDLCDVCQNCILVVNCTQVCPEVIEIIQTAQAIIMRLRSVESYPSYEFNKNK